jgi:hypothetical protein
MSTYDIDVRDLNTSYVPSATPLKTSILTVSENVTWVNPRPTQIQCILNPNLGHAVCSFPVMRYFLRRFQVTATNVAKGFDREDVVVNIERNRIVVTTPTMLQTQINYPASAGVYYKVESNDTQWNKNRPPSIIPTITGGTRITMVWPSLSISGLKRVFINWTPSTSYNQPVIYYTNTGAQPLTLWDAFKVGQEYMFKFTCEETDLYVSEVQTQMYIPSLINSTEYYKVFTPTGSTNVTLSWRADYITKLSVSWQPRTTSEFIVDRAVPIGMSSMTISGFEPSKKYTFMFVFAPDKTGTINGLTTQFDYVTNYLQPVATFLMPSWSLTEPSLRLSWSLDVPAPMYISIKPSNVDSLSAYYSLLVPENTASATFRGLVLGEPYDIQYIVKPNSTGVYGERDYGIVHSHLVLKNNLIIDGSRVVITGATAITINWSGLVFPASSGYISWLDQRRDFAATQTSLTIDYSFVVGEMYTFVITFPETDAYYESVIQKMYTPAYLPRPAIAILQPAEANSSGSSVQLAWSMPYPLQSSGKVTYYSSSGVLMEQIFAIGDSKIVLTGLVAGYSYLFKYYFNPDTTGVYSGYTVSGPAFTPKAIPYIDRADILITGGRIITLSWKLKVDLDGVIEQLNGIATNIAWTPATPSLYVHREETVNNQITVPTNGNMEFMANTPYWFTLTFAAGPKSKSLSITHPPQSSSGYIPQLRTPSPPLITITGVGKSQTSADLVLNWIYEAIAPVTIIWDQPSGIGLYANIKPYDENGQIVSSFQIPEVLNGTTYTFTFQFDQDITGNTLGITYVNTPYTVPLYPDIEVAIAPYSSATTRDVVVTWIATVTRDGVLSDLDTLVDIIARPPVGYPSIIVYGVPTTIGYRKLNNLVANLTYNIEVTFHLTRTTWPVTVLKEYFTI